MIMRANVVVPSIVATALVTLAWTQSPVTALGSVFNAGAPDGLVLALKVIGR